MSKIIEYKDKAGNEGEMPEEQWNGLGPVDKRAFTKTNEKRAATAPKGVAKAKDNNSDKPEK